MVSQHTRSSTLLPNIAESQNVSPGVKIKFKIIPHATPRPNGSLLDTSYSSRKGKAPRTSICHSNSSRSSSSFWTIPASTPSPTSTKFEQDSTRCYQDPISSRVLSRKTRIQPAVTFTERERYTQPIQDSKYDTASFKTSEPQDVETSESTDLVKAAEYQDVETSEYGYAEVFGYERTGEEYLVAAKPGLTQKQLKRSSVAWLEQAGAVHAGSLASLCANEETKASSEQALDDVLDLILTLIPTKEE